MKYLFSFLVLVMSSTTMFGQSVADTLYGKVSYRNSQSIYVKFPSTKEIAVGDTLYIADQGLLIPALLVKHTSSTSCVGTSLTDVLIDTGTSIVFIKRIIDVQPDRTPLEEIIETMPIDPIDPEEGGQEETKSTKAVSKKTDIRGRFSAAAYMNFAEQSQGDKQRMRYTLTANANRINNSRFSAETYMSFRHTIDEWDEVTNNFKRAFKVYNLAVSYDMDNGTRFWAGRKINFNISNIGAIDGFQGEKKWNKFFIGGFVGSRPDNTDYDYNPQLFQYGAYLGNIVAGKNGTMQSTLALVEQRNGHMTDRRFAYIQHQNTSIKNINIFTSFEFDLYTVVNEQPKNTLDITSLYFSIRYRPTNKLSFFGSYDARNNVIYYETYKNNIDQLLEDETRKGFRLSFNYRPWKTISIGSNAGYRFQKDNPTTSQNLNSYITFSRVPGLKASATLTALRIHSAYLDGTVYGIRLSRDIIKGKVFGQAEFRTVKYQYKNVENPLNQSIAGLNISWRLTKKLSFAFNFEGEFQQDKSTSRVFTSLIQRF